MGAKTAMVVALRSPEKVATLIAVDNAPVDAALKSDFATYIKGMRDVERAKPKKQAEADELLKPYAKVFWPDWAPSVCSSHKYYDWSRMANWVGGVGFSGTTIPPNKFDTIGG
jgi:pimeloyl-ACP methyl ester carboxylesterase